MKIEQQIRALCTPAKIYFILSVLFILAVSVTSFFHEGVIGTTSRYGMSALGINSMEAFIIATLIKLAFVLIWTYILQELCKNGYKNLSWFLILLPFLGVFISTIFAIISKIYHTL